MLGRSFIEPDVYLLLRGINCSSYLSKSPYILGIVPGSVNPKASKNTCKMKFMTAVITKRTVEDLQAQTP